MIVPVVQLKMMRGKNILWLLKQSSSIFVQEKNVWTIIVFHLYLVM